MYLKYTKQKLGNMKCGRKFINLTGQKLGKLLVLNKFNSNPKEVRWDCLCDCGNKKNVSTHCLRNGHVKSCGCFQRKRPYESLYNKLKWVASDRCNSLNITYEEYVEFTKITQCHYCGSAIKWDKHFIHKGNSHGYKLDRKDNNKGYSKDNCVVCCSMCNFVKSDKFTYDEMLKIGPFLKEVINERQS